MLAKIDPKLPYLCLMLPVEQFLTFLTNKCGVGTGQQFLLAVSGGRDSVLLAQLFKQAGLHFAIAHCNFNLRGEEANRDEQFVRNLALQLAVPFHCTGFDTETYALAHKISIQMAARALRYQWFDELVDGFGYQYVALAQHQTDAVETVLLNLVRGTGISGLHGILPRRNHLIRPLLFLSRQQIETLVHQNQLAFVEDSSNASDKYARNNIRINILPHLRDINPSLEETFTHNIDRFAQTEQVLNTVVAQLRQRMIQPNGDAFYINIEQVKALEPQHLLFFELVKDFGFNYQMAQEVLQNLHRQSGTAFYSATHSLVVNRCNLVVNLIDNNQYPPLLWHVNQAHISFANNELQWTQLDSATIIADPNRAYVDAEKLVFPLVIRFWQPQDRFRPLGMRGSKKLSDFFIAQKIPLPQKNKIPILVNGNGEVVWVVGHRQDDRYKICATTKKVAIFEIINKQQSG